MCAVVTLSPFLVACPGRESSGPGIQVSGFAADLKLDFRAGNGAVYVLTNVGDRVDTYTITLNDSSASVTPDEVQLAPGGSIEIGIAGADAGSTLTVVSAGSGGVAATSTTG